MRGRLRKFRCLGRDAVKTRVQTAGSPNVGAWGLSGWKSDRSSITRASSEPANLTRRTLRGAREPRWKMPEISLSHNNLCRPKKTSWAAKTEESRSTTRLFALAFDGSLPVAAPAVEAAASAVSGAGVSDVTAVQAVTGTASGAFVVWENCQCVRMIREAHGGCGRAVMCIDFKVLKSESFRCCASYFYVFNLATCRKDSSGCQKKSLEYRFRVNAARSFASRDDI